MKKKELQELLKNISTSIIVHSNDHEYVESLKLLQHEIEQILNQDDSEKINEYANNLENFGAKMLLDGKIAGPLSNYPSKDKPWLNSFSYEEIIRPLYKKTMYQDLIDSNKDNPDSIAIEYYGNKITYQELIDNIEKTASALKSIGVEKGDKVTVSMPYLPETIYTIYAINKIGAVVNMIDPRINKELMTEYISEANSKYAIIISKIDDKIASIKDNTSLEHIISVPATNSVKNNLLKVPSYFKKSKFTSWNEFIKKGTAKVDTVNYEENTLAVIEYTSGTSGKPKGVMLSNDSLVALNHSSRISYKCNVGDKFLLIMPPFIAYGLAIGMHDMLCMGQHLLMIPNFTLDKAKKMFPKLLKKYHPNYIMGVPNFLLFLLDYNDDLSFLKGIVIGGDHLEESLEKKIRKKCPNLKILKGWGMTEIASCGVFTKTEDNNSLLGSVGVPLLGNNSKILKLNEEGIYNIDKSPECPHNEDGLLFIKSPTHAMGYYQNTEETDKVFITDENGNTWINTGDVFSINENGYHFFKNRVKRIVVRPDGHNIPSTQIEKICQNATSNLTEDPIRKTEVLNAIVVGIPSVKYDHGKQAAVCIQVNNPNLTFEEINDLFINIDCKCTENLEPRNRPKYIVLVDDIPMTSNGKVDYNKLTEIAKELVESKITSLKDFDENSNEIIYINNQPQNIKTKKLKK